MRDGESIRASDMRYLPIVSAYARTLGVVGEIERLCGHERGVSPGRIVLALMVDALSGRTPLFRLPQAFAELDTELLLGEAISQEKLNDDAVGRTLDRLYEVGTAKVLSAVSLRAVKLFDLDTTHVHHDTTSRTVYGDYDLYGEETHDQPFIITFGFSKERRAKRLERTLEQDRAELAQKAQEEGKIEYACLPDAQAALSRLPKGRFHELIGRIEEKPVYATGRPKADGTRNIKRTAYWLKISLQPREQAIARARKEAGCFVLITNEPEEAMGLAFRTFLSGRGDNFRER